MRRRPGWGLGFEVEEVFEGFAADHEVGLIVGGADADDGGPHHHVVAAGHGVAVGAGGGEGHDVTWANVLGEVTVVDEDVTGFAVGPDDTGWDEWGVGAAVDESDVVFGAVEGGPNVIAHAAVDADVAAGFAAVNGDVFDGADGVDGDGAGSGDGRPGSTLMNGMVRWSRSA